MKIKATIRSVKPSKRTHLTYRYNHKGIVRITFDFGGNEIYKTMSVKSAGYSEPVGPENKTEKTNTVQAIDGLRYHFNVSYKAKYCHRDSYVNKWSYKDNDGKEAAKYSYSWRNPNGKGSW